MARRRMFCTELVSSDQFLSMPPTAQNLYFQLCLHGDDEGFVAGPASVARLCGAGADDLQILDDEDFIISFDTGVVLITDWHLHNTIRKDRSVPTHHRIEKSLIQLVCGRYFRLTDINYQETVDPCDTVSTESMSKMTTNMTTNMATQNRIEQNRAEQSRVDESRSEKKIIEENISVHSISSTAAADEDSEDFLERVARDMDAAREREKEKQKAYMVPTDIPSIGQVCAYFKGSGLDHLDPFGFYSYFNRRDWKDQKGNPIYDWKALARRWKTPEEDRTATASCESKKTEQPAETDWEALGYSKDDSLPF